MMKRAVFLRIPTPETSPRVVGPEAAQHRADETEKYREAHHAVDHAGQIGGPLFRERGGQDTADDIQHTEQSGDECCRVAECNARHMRGQPELRIEHGLQHYKGVTAVRGQAIGDEQGGKAGDAGDDIANPQAIDPFEHHAQQHAAPAHEDGGGIQVRNRRPSGNVDPRNQGGRV